MSKKKDNSEMEDHNNKIFWKVIHNNPMDSTSVILYVNSPAGYYASEYKIRRNTYPRKRKELKEAMVKEKNFLLNGEIPENERKNKYSELRGHEEEPPPSGHLSTRIHIQYYKYKKLVFHLVEPKGDTQIKKYFDKYIPAPTTLFYNRYFLPGADHQVELIVDGEHPDSALEDYVFSKVIP